MQATGERQARDIRDIDGRKTAKTDSTAIGAALIPIDTPHADAGCGGQVADCRAALGMEINVENIAATFAVGVTGAKLEVVVGAEEIYLALHRIVGEAEVDIPCKGRRGSQ